MSTKLTEEVPISKSAHMDSYIAFASFEPVPSKAVSTDYVRYAKEIAFPVSEPIRNKFDLKYRAKSICSRDCSRDCQNNRVYIHNFSHSISRQDMEEWLERVGVLEIATKSGKQHRHLVIWDNENGSCDAVA